jgi:hypothetical protein
MILLDSRSRNKNTGETRTLQIPSTSNNLFFRKNNWERLCDLVCDINVRSHHVSGCRLDGASKPKITASMNCDAFDRSRNIKSGVRYHVDAGCQKPALMFHLRDSNFAFISTNSNVNTLVPALNVTSRGEFTQWLHGEANICQLCQVLYLLEYDRAIRPSLWCHVIEISISTGWTSLEKQDLVSPFQASVDYWHQLSPRYGTQIFQLDIAVLSLVTHRQSQPAGGRALRSGI